MKPNIGITEKNLKAIGNTLSNVLSNAVVLYTKTRKFHWNVSGESFMEFHKLFEQHYTQLEASIDEIAERINKLGNPTIGTMQEFLSMSAIKEAPGKYPSSKEMLKELLKDHETIIQELRKYVDQCDEEYKDRGTADFLTKIMEDHETLAWTLRRYF
ncbi:MAG: DNA starvation/stationary phase protection protein [Bacteroidota bacterium]